MADAKKPQRKQMEARAVVVSEHSSGDHIRPKSLKTHQANVPLLKPSFATVDSGDTIESKLNTGNVKSVDLLITDTTGKIHRLTVDCTHFECTASTKKPAFERFTNKLDKFFSSLVY
jgi:hypothetical protein